MEASLSGVIDQPGRVADNSVEHDAKRRHDEPTAHENAPA
jgi:hypothetical protein